MMGGIAVGLSQPNTLQAILFSEAGPKASCRAKKWLNTVLPEKHRALCLFWPQGIGHIGHQ
ncbi:MAG: hypothetical protein ACI89L_002509 [Phycisphaerales bacterium]|jgi:hypothetical protein